MLLTGRTPINWLTGLVEPARESLGLRLPNTLAETSSLAG
jgi:hypothetical protein